MSTKIRAVVCFTLGLGAVLLAEAGAELKATREVRRAFIQSSWRLGGIEASPFGRTVVLRDLDGTFGGTHVSVGRIELGRPSLGTLTASLLTPNAVAAPPTPPPRPGTLTQPTPPPVPGNAFAENIVVTGKTMTYRIKRIDLTNSLLSSNDVAVLFDTKSAETIADRLKKVSASTITIHEIVGDSANPGVEQHWIQKQLVLNTVVAGKAASASSGPLTFAYKEGNGSSGGSIDAMQMTNVDLAQVAHVASSLRTSDDEPVLPLFDSITANGLQVTDSRQDGAITVETVTERGVRARAPKTDLPISAAVPIPNPNDSATKIALIDDALHSFEADSIEFRSLSVPIGDDDGPAKIGVSEFFVHGLAQGRVGESGLRGLTYVGSNGRVLVGAINVGGFQLPLARGADGKAAAAVPVIDKLSIEDIDCNLAIRDKKAEDTTTRIQFRVARLGFSGDGVGPNMIPRKSAIQLDHLTFDVTPQTDAIKVFSAMGYSRLDLSSGLTADYDEAKQELEIKPLAVSGVDMGSLMLELDLGKVDKELVSADQQAARNAAQSIVANRMDLKLKNEGLFERALDMKAKMDGLTVDDERRNAIDFFSNQLPEFVNGHPAAKRLGDAVAKFIGEPKTLHVTIASKRGLGAGDMALILSPDVLLDSIELEASAND